jgi:V-type H+-transporting ATPase proteolipid subunit
MYSITDKPGSFFYGYLGVAAAISLSNLGAAYGTAKAGVGICTMGILKPEKIIKAIIPVIMAGILGIYGLIVGVILVQKIKNDKLNYNFDFGFKHLAAGLCVGISAWAAGIAIGIAGDAAARALGQQDKIFVGMMLILIFADPIPNPQSPIPNPHIY